MNVIVLIYLVGVIFNLLFALVYWYQQRRVLEINYLGALFFILLSWLIYPLILLRSSVGR
ncbi:hypothetical protein [Halanaerobacter jeridensis]|uniref:Uncharacterized protein n=1 Tax=Halanaerobacter jeridensis TaxID=706427 RepID=A0A938XND2_9FIRM|nr:hypothetical protein [Halanaerobacter jeridensis]MBM7555282.1 hypothetical protein [Halanaerobacter jeridensis]